MKRTSLFSGLLLTFGCALSQGAFAQDDELEVTLRVLDDVSDIDAVLVAIDEHRDQAEDGEHGQHDADARGDEQNDEEEADHEQRGRDEGARDDERNERHDGPGRDDLEDPDDEEHGDHAIEDRDVEEDREHGDTSAPGDGGETAPHDGV